MNDGSNRALIIGGGSGGCAMMEMLWEEKLIQVAGIVDAMADAPGMELARARGVPTFLSIDEALKACEPCMVFNLTGDMQLDRELAEKGHIGGIIGGVEALMMWRMVTRLQEMQNTLFYQAHHDPLTGAYNRRYMIDHLEQGISEADRYDLPYSIVMMDLDHFKQINDTYGHAAGDAVLNGVVSSVGQRLRQADILGRWGGEEFLVLLPHADETQALSAAGKWLKHISAKPMDMGNGESRTVTFSAGVAVFDKKWMKRGKSKAVDAFLERADKSLYQAKMTGRNRVVGSQIQ